MGKITKGLLALAAVILSSIVFGLYNAWLFSNMWEWYVTPLGLPKLNVLGAYGFVMLISMLKLNMAVKLEQLTKQEEASPLQQVSRLIVESIGITVGLTIITVAGYIVHQFM